MSAEQPWLDDAEAGSAPWDRDMEVGALDRSVPNAPHGIVNAIISGLESSATGLVVRGELPSQTLPQESTWGERAAAGIAGVIADLPESVVGAVAGSPAGPVGMGAGAVAAPMALREALMTAYAQGGVHSWSDAWEVAKSALEGGAKGAVIGGLTAGAGRLATAAGAGVVTRTAAEITALTTSGAALEGRMPTAQDFIDGAIVVGGLHGATRAAVGLKNLYAKTGVKPSEVALDAVNDQSVKKDLLADPTKIPKAYEAKALEESVKAAVPEALDRATAARFAENPFATIEQAKGEPARPTHINYNYINGEAELSGVLSRLSGLYEKQIQTARRGTVPIEQTLAESRQVLADMLGTAVDKVSAERVLSAEPGPPIVRYRKIAAGIESRLPAVADGFTRMWRGNRPGEVGQNPQFTNDLPGIALPFKEGYGGPLSYVDVLTKDISKYENRGVVAAGAEFILPPEIAKKAVAVEIAPAAGGVQPAKLAATLQAKRQLAVDAAQELKSQGKALADLGANASEAQVTAYLAHTERASMILADFLGMRAEVARAQQSLQSIVSSSMDLTAVQKLLDSHGGKGKVLDFARIMGDADNPTSILRAAQAMVKPTLFEKSVEIWKAGILSGPTTHLANLFGNTVSTVMKFPERLTAAAIGKLHGGEKVTVAEVRALASGMGSGSLGALKVAGQAASDAIRLKETLPDASKVEQYRNAVGGKTGEFVRIPFKLLTAGDLLFRTLNEHGEAHALAVRQAMKENFAPGTREFGARVVDLVQNPTEAMAQAIVAAGDKATFTTKLGARGAHLQMLVKGSPAEFMLPFIKTPVNLLKWAAEYTPGVNLLMESVRADLSGKNGNAARDIAVARMIVGSVVATVVIEAVDAGAITGGGLADPEKRRAKVAAGWQPYSLKIGDSYYSYQRVDPLARIMSAAADASELYHVAGENDKLNLAGAITAAVGNATISQTYLSGLANAINAVTDPNRYAGRWLDQYAASLVPGLLGQTAAAIDPQAREVNSMMDAMQARIPLLREQLLPKRNPLTGEPVKGTERVAPFAPVIVSEESKDKVLTEAARLGVRLPIAPREVTVAGRVGKLGKVEISPEARNAFTEKQGTFAHEILSQIVNTPAWDAIPDMIKLDIYSKIMTAARTQAALVALPPEARGAEVTRIANEITDKLSVAK